MFFTRFLGDVIAEANGERGHQEEDDGDRPMGEEIDVGIEGDQVITLGEKDEGSKNPAKDRGIHSPFSSEDQTCGENDQDVDVEGRAVDAFAKVKERAEGRQRCNRKEATCGEANLAAMDQPQSRQADSKDDRLSERDLFLTKDRDGNDGEGEKERDIEDIVGDLRLEGFLFIVGEVGTAKPRQKRQVTRGEGSDGGGGKIRHKNIPSCMVERREERSWGGV